MDHSYIISQFMFNKEKEKEQKLGRVGFDFSAYSRDEIIIFIESLSNDCSFS